MAHTYRKPPISSHRLFPVIVAIWFAALFGLGCLVLPAILLEHVTQASGVARLVPAAAPPLGMTARIALACAAGVIGALLGFAIARRVAAAQAPGEPVNFDRLLRPADAAPVEGVRRPISALEELGAERLDAPVEPQSDGPPLLRKRRLALPEEPELDPFVQLDPLSGLAPRWADEHPLMPSAAALADKVMALHGQNENLFANETTPEPQAHAAVPEEPPAPVAEPEPELYAEPEFYAEPEVQLEPEAEPETVPAWQEACDESDAFCAPPVQETPFVGETASDPAPVAADPAPLAFSAPSQAKPPAAAIRGRAALAEPLRALLAGEAAPADNVSGPLQHLGMAELAERLARSMRNYDNRQPAAEAGPLDAIDFEPAPAAAATPPPAIPAAPQPFAPELEEFGEDEDEDVFYLALGASPVAEPADSDGEDLDEALEEPDSADYGSLLAMTGAPRPFDVPAEADRQDAEPNTRSDQAETDRALRSALATLQRVSGAA